MPAAITHYLHANAVLKELKLSDADQKDAFFWGAQGPDFFFGHRSLSLCRRGSLQEMGAKLHGGSPAAVLEAMRACSGEPYFYGFLCHYALDRTCHPYIRWASADLEQKSSDTQGVCHNRIESMLDIIMLRRERGEVTTDFDMRATLPHNPPVQKEIAESYRRAILSLYREAVEQKDILQAENDYRRELGFLRDRAGVKKYLAERWEKRRGTGRTVSCFFRGLMEDDEYDYANIAENPWTHDGEKHSESFFDLYEKAREDALDLICRAKEDGSVLTGNIPF